MGIDKASVEIHQDKLGGRTFFQGFLVSTITEAADPKIIIDSITVILRLNPKKFCLNVLNSFWWKDAFPILFDIS